MINNPKNTFIYNDYFNESVIINISKLYCKFNEDIFCKLEEITIKSARLSKTFLLIFVVFFILLSIIIIIGFNNYTNHKNTVIRQQQENLLTLAKTISRSLDVFINYKTNGLAMLANEPLILEALMIEDKETHNENKDIMLRFFEKYIGETDSVMLLNIKGDLIYEFPLENQIVNKKSYASIIKKVLTNKEGFVTKEYLFKPGQFSIDIVHPVMKDDEVQGILVDTINLNKVYDNFIDPVQPGKKGYSMVKNREGFIIMHPVEGQVGIESIKVRKEMFPNYDWSELEELNRKQLEEGEGYFIYNSNWWQNYEVETTRKINSFTTFYKEDISWIIAVQMDYKEIEEPIKGTLVNLSIISLIILIMVIAGLYVIFKMDKRKKALEIETKYLKELNNTWEELVKSEARLRHSQKLQTIGVLTSGIVHEFNNLLSPILGYSEMLLQNIDSTSYIYEDILEINKSSIKAKEIINQLLLFSKPDTSVTDFRPLEISPIIEESINLIKPIMPNNIKVILNINSKAQIFGNSTQIQQVLINLYTNSCYAMKKTGGTIEINAEDVNLNLEESKILDLYKGEFLRIQVRDDGIGMDENTLKQIFEYFFTTKETGQGTGLGLGVVRNIIENHKGKIFAKSEVGEGTIMVIYIPVIKNYDSNLTKF